MSTDPTFTVEWTVPADEWGDDAHDDHPDSTARDTAHPTPSDAASTTAATSDRADTSIDTTNDAESTKYANRDPESLPPAPVLAAHVDALRADRAARESELEAVRERYETVIDARNAEIRELRARQNASLLDRLRGLL